jgi:hypothetical protein
MPISVVLRRRKLRFHLEVDDARSQRALGQLVDIPPKGLRVAGEAPLSPGEQYTLRMRLPTEVGGTAQLEARARVKWSKPTASASISSPKVPIGSTRCSGFARGGWATPDVRLKSDLLRQSATR